jgi:membrane associated rhomboid family serine protease
MIPYAVDAPLDRRPIVNWLICAGLVLVFYAQWRVSGKLLEPFVPEKWGMLGLVWHNWFHPNIYQLIANVLFLWPFGNAVCAKIGNKGYLGMYLGLSLAGGLVHLAIRHTAAVGMNVALSGVVGMYLVFFPENAVSCFFFFPRPITLSVTSYFVMSMWLVADIFQSIVGGRTITFPAHVFGFGVGVCLGIAALKKGWVEMGRGDKSLLQVLRREEEPEEEESGKKKRAEEREEETDTEKIEPEAAKSKTAIVEAAASKTAVVEAEEQQDEFIRFNCECGRRIKVPRRYAGKAGRCPYCKREVRVPER